MDSIYNSVGWNGLFSIFITLGFVAVCWVLLQDVKWDQFIRHPRSPRARLLQLFLAIVLGRLIAGFVLDYWNWTTALKWLFASQ